MAFLTGARGFLLKDAGPGLLIQAIQAAANGDAFIARSVTARLCARFVQSASCPERTQPVVALTEREKEVTVTVAQLLTNVEIAAALHISLSTATFHVASPSTKIGDTSCVQIVIWPTRPDGFDPERSGTDKARLGFPSGLRCRWIDAPR